MGRDAPEGDIQPILPHPKTVRECDPEILSENHPK